MSELFPVEETMMDSPRISWIKKYSVSVRQTARGYYATSMRCSIANAGTGATEEEAIRDLGVQNNWTLWNEL